MTASPGPDLTRLRRELVAWFVCVRPDGSPHVTPGWFVFAEGTWWVATARRNVKVRNIQLEDEVSLALPDPDRPVVAQGRARIHCSEFPAAVSQAFAAKYDGWDIASEEPDGPRVLIEVETSRWLFAGLVPAVLARRSMLTCRAGWQAVNQHGDAT